MSTEVSDPQQRLEDRRRVSELLKKELQGFRCLVCKGIEFVVLADDKRLRAEGIPLCLSPGGPTLLRDDLS
jgi:hypothetical protein